MSLNSIHHWLDDVPADVEHHGRPRKRQRLDPVTPESSARDRKQDGAAAMNDGENQIAIPLGEELDSISEDSYVVSESESEGLTPRKHMRALRLDRHGIQFHDLAALEQVPPGARELMRRVDAIMECQGIISTARREAMLQASRMNRGFSWANINFVYTADDGPEAGFSSPSPEAVLSIVDASTECGLNGHPEANWNMEVNQRILDLAFRSNGQRPAKNLVNFMGSTTATIMPEYGTSQTLGKADFCVYLNTVNDATPCLQLAMRTLWKILPGNTLNFTDYIPLDDRTVAFSITTKSSSDGVSAAMLYLGVWQVAHWDFLRQLLDRLSRQTQNRSDSPAALPFIPGIMVSDHEWHMVFTTLEDRQTQFWHKMAIGSSATPKGIYQVVRVLQLLGQWARDTYWPWLRDLILKLHALTPQ